MNSIINFIFRSKLDLYNRCYYCQYKLSKYNDVYMADDKQFCSHSHRERYLINKEKEILRVPSTQKMIIDDYSSDSESEDNNFYYSYFDKRSNRYINQEFHFCCLYC